MSFQIIVAAWKWTIEKVAYLSHNAAETQNIFENSLLTLPQETFYEPQEKIFLSALNPWLIFFYSLLFIPKWPFLFGNSF